MRSWYAISWLSKRVEKRRADDSDDAAHLKEVVEDGITEDFMERDFAKNAAEMALEETVAAEWIDLEKELEAIVVDDMLQSGQAQQLHGSRHEDRLLHDALLEGRIDKK